MDVWNNTPLRFGVLAGRINFSGDSLTLIVKGTYDLVPGAEATPVEEQPYPTGDEFYPDDEEQTGGARYEADLAYMKPAADVLLVGKCYAPAGDPVVMCPVTPSSSAEGTAL